MAPHRQHTSAGERTMRPLPEFFVGAGHPPRDSPGFHPSRSPGPPSSLSPAMHPRPRHCARSSGTWAGGRRKCHLPRIFSRSRKSPCPAASCWTSPRQGREMLISRTTLRPSVPRPGRVRHRHGRRPGHGSLHESRRHRRTAEAGAIRSLDLCGPGSSWHKAKPECGRSWSHGRSGRATRR